MTKYLVHKAVKLEKVKKARQAVLTDEYIDANYIVQPKYDGCFGIVDTVRQRVLSRTGEIVRSCDHILAACTNWFGPGIYLGEVYHPTLPQAEISGDFRRHRACPELTFVLFDALTVEEFDAGLSIRPYQERLDTALVKFWPASFADHTIKTVKLAGFDNYREALSLYAGTAGYDGVIARDPNAGWTAGSGTGGEILKFKRDCGFDLECIAVYEGEGKHAGRMGALGFRYKGGKEVRVGTGFTDAEREQIWRDHEVGGGPMVEQAVGLIEAMSESNDGSLREPRFKQWRFDKEAPDF